jgi:hypothetical protein
VKGFSELLLDGADGSSLFVKALVDLVEGFGKSESQREKFEGNSSKSFMRTHLELDTSVSFSPLESELTPSSRSDGVVAAF